MAESMASRFAKGPTVAALAARYLEEHVTVRCKPRSVVLYRLAVEKHILPEFGQRSALGVGQAQVAELSYKLRKTLYMANRVVDVLSRIFNLAEDWGAVPEGSNPCGFQVKYKQRSRERFLTEEEFRRLGRVLSEAETCRGVSVHAVAAMRLLMLTGCWRNKILTLRWEDVDPAANELHLRDSKTGARTLSLSPEAAKVLAEVPRAAENPFVIPGRITGTYMRNVNDPWKIIRERAG